jgi:hypothetical protein
MLKPMKFLFALLLLIPVQPLLADGLRCSTVEIIAGAGQTVPIPCSESQLNTHIQFPTETISGNHISINTDLEVDVSHHFTTPYGFPYTDILTASDIFFLPSSAAGDIFKISGVYGMGFSESGARLSPTFSDTITIGPGNPVDNPKIVLVPDAVNDTKHCYSIFACAASYTLPADDSATSPWIRRSRSRPMEMLKLAALSKRMSFSTSTGLRQMV